MLELYENHLEVIIGHFRNFNKNLWICFNKGYGEFEVVPSKGSELDIIIKVKFGADNKTISSKPYVKDKYISGGRRWWKNVVRSNFKIVTIENKKYKLSRF